MPDTPLVSVIIPVFNAERYIAQTIESVLAQTYTSWEMILVDDCSSDSGCSLIEGYLHHPNIQLIRSPENSGGPATPRNMGIEAARGHYLAFLDADDLWEPAKLQRQIAFMQTNALAFSSTDAINIDEENATIPDTLLERLMKKIKRPTLQGLIVSNFISLSSVMIEAASMTPFNTAKAYVAVEDYCKWLELFESGKVKYGYLNQPLLRYRVLDTSISERSADGKQELKALKCVIDFIFSKGRYDLLPLVYKANALRYVRNLLRR